MNSNVFQFKTTSESAKRALVDYANAVSEVSAYAYSIGKTELPVLRSPFQTYADYVEKFGLARSHALVWLDSVLPNFHRVPSSMVNLSLVMQTQLDSLTQSLEHLKSNPQDAEIIARIRGGFSVLHDEISQTLESVTDLEDTIINFTTNIDDDAQSLKNLAQAAEDAEKGDRGQIQKLQDVVKEIKSTMSTMDERMTLEKFGQWDMKILLVAAGITAGLVTGGPAGSIVVGVLGATVTSFIPIGGSVINEDDVKQLQKQMDRVSSEIGDLNTDIGLLQSIATEFNALSSTATTKLHACLTEVKDFWHSLDQEVQTVLDQFNDIMSEWATTDKIDKAIDELIQFRHEWSQIEEAASKLAKMQYDFSSEVQTAA